MSKPRPSSMLSDLIRQATTSTDLPESSQTSDVLPERPSQRPSTTAPPTAEELAEAFFPGSSIREHAFFPKSLTTHSQLSHSHTHYGFLGSFKPAGNWPTTDHAQAGGGSPSYTTGSMRRSAGPAGPGDGGSAATSHSHHQLARQPSIAEAEGEGQGDRAVSAAGASGAVGAGRRDVQSPSPSLQTSAPPGSESWSAWHRWMSPGMSGTSPDSPGPLGALAADPRRGGAASQQAPHPGHHHNQQQHQQNGLTTEAGQRQYLHSPLPQGQLLPPSLPQSSFMLQPQLSRRKSLAREGGASGRRGSMERQVQHTRQLECLSLYGDGASDMTEPLLLHDHSIDPPDVEAPLSTVATTAGDLDGPGPGAGAYANGGATSAAAAAAAAAAGSGYAAAAGGPPELPADIRRRSGVFNSVVFGIINAVVSMPTLIAYTAIVFKAPLYVEYIDSLCRFFFFSSAIHQLVFVCMSSLPFAIGQVQDVGLIFLSAMASDIAVLVTGPGAAEVALGSSLLAMTLSTFIVGLLTVFVARLKLADMVSYVPLPVVGGYLGFVGYFCIAGGTALAAGVQVDTLVSWLHLLAADPALKLLPTAASIAALMLCVEHVTHPLALPALLTAIPLIFHGVLWGMGWDLGQAQQAGWVMKPTEGLSNCWQLWSLYNLQNGGLAHGVDVRAMLAQLPKLAGLFLVVCFGSCMDVAAIQSDMPTPLDFNRELMTVGVSNMVTGAVGAGYTGSYIFSQTVFTMRQGVFNRVNGLTVAIVELLVFALPFSVVQYMPNFFFGALLVWFGIEISRDWLILSYRKLSRAEYVLLWATFLAIMNLGLELGIGAGIVMATLYFAYQYAQSQVSSLRQVAARSGRTHMYDTSSTLDLLGQRMAVLRLAGYVFFGSSTGLSNQVLQLAARMLQERAEEQRQHEEWALSAERGDAKEGELSRSDLAAVAASAALPVSNSAPAVVHVTPPPPQQQPPRGAAGHGADGNSGGATAEAEAGAAGEVAGSDGTHAGAAGAAAPPPAGQPGRVGSDGGDGGMSPAERHWRAAVAISHAPVVLILDFGSVSGLDSTAARTFATLVTTLASQRVNVIFASMRRPDCRKLLEANGLPLRPYMQPAGSAPREAGPSGEGASNGGDAKLGGGQSGLAAAESPLVRPSAGGCWEFSSAAEAVRCCEDAYLGLAMAVGLLPAAPSQAASLQQLLTRNLREVFRPLPADLSGLVAELEGALTRRQLQLGDVLYPAGAAVREVYVIEFGALLEEEHYEGGVRVGSREHGAGVVVGALEFFLGRPAPATVRCSSAAACQLLCISRGCVSRLMAQHPRALAALQVLLLRSTCLDLASAQEAANHGVAA